jgi:hypothetical protein
MGRRRVRAYEQERPEGPHLQRVQDAEQAVEEQGSPQGEVLRLQETAGNEAVSRMLVQRDSATADEAVPMDTGGAVKATLVLDDKLGVFPLISFSKGQGNEYVVIIPSTDHDPEFAQYNLNGTKIEKAKISTQRYDIELDDVYVSSVEMGHGGGGDRTIQVTLSYAAQSFKKTMP